MCSIGWFTLIIYSSTPEEARARRFAQFKVQGPAGVQGSKFKAQKNATDQNATTVRWRRQWRIFRSLIMSTKFASRRFFVSRRRHSWVVGGEACPLRFMSGRTAPRLWSPSMLTSVGRGELSNYTCGCKGSKFVCKSQVFRELSAF